MIRSFFPLLTGFVLFGLVAASSGRQAVPPALSASDAWITFTIRNMSLRSGEQMIGFLKPGQSMHSSMIHPYPFGPFSAQTFTYPVGTKVECIQQIDLRGRPQAVYLLAVLTMRDQGRTFKLSL